MGSVLSKYEYSTDDMLTEILTKLPVKSLIRFKGVTRQWCRIISHPSFVKAHLLSDRSPTIIVNLNLFHTTFMHCSPRSLLSDHLQRTDATAITNSPANDTLVFIVGSLNGLLCLHVGSFHNHVLVIWNPGTGFSKQLPPYNYDMDDFQHYAFGFGYKESSDDYVVLGIFIPPQESDETSQVEIYSSRTNSWRILGDFTFGVIIYEDWFGKWAAGRLYFCTWHPDDDRYGVGHRILFDIVSFDLENEVFGMVAQPDYGDGLRSLSMEVLGGSLCVLSSKENKADVWVMTNNGLLESWTKTATIPYFNFPGTFGYSQPLVRLQSGKILLVQLTRFVVYDPTDNSVIVPMTNMDAFGEAHAYVESLVSLCPAQDEVAGGQDQSDAEKGTT